MKNISYLLSELNKLSGTKKKLALLLANADMPNLEQFFDLALNPRYTYFTTKLPPVRIVDAGTYITDFEVRKAMILLANADTRLSSMYALSKVWTSKLTKHQRSYITRIIKRKPGVGIGAAQVNKVWPRLIPVQKYQGAIAEDKKKITRLTQQRGVVILQKKYAGAHLICDHGELVTRQGAVIRMTETYAKHLTILLGTKAHYTYLAGELMFPGNTRTGFLKEADINGRLNARELDGQLHVLFEMHEAGDGDVAYEDRMHELDTYLDAYTTECKRRGLSRLFYRADEACVTSYAQARAVVDAWIAQGEEGGVLKDPYAQFIQGKHAHCIKLKYEQEVDAYITGWYPHKTKPWQIGGFNCECPSTGSSKLLKFNVGSGLSDNIRESTNPDSFIGQVATCTITDITASKAHDWLSCKNPRFNCNKVGTADTVLDVFDRYRAKTGTLHELAVLR